MKKANILIPLFFLLIFSSKTNAQKYGFEEDDFAISASIGAFGARVGELEESGYKFQFSNAMFLNKNVTAGFKFGFDGISGLNDNLSLGLFSRYYFSPEKRFSLFGNVGFDYMSQNNGDSKENISVFKLTPGVSYFLTENLILEAAIGGFGLSAKSVKDKEATINSNKLFFGANMSSLQFGIVFRKN
jgi:outer membrane protein